MHKTGYEAHVIYFCIDSYKETNDTWRLCPNCNLKPREWTFNNGSSTGCGCGKDEYDHFSIHSESIGSVIERTGGSATEYDCDGLRKNWNYWVETGDILFEHASKRNDGRW